MQTTIQHQFENMADALCIYIHIYIYIYIYTHRCTLCDVSPLLSLVRLSRVHARNKLSEKLQHILQIHEARHRFSCGPHVIHRCTRLLLLTGSVPCVYNREFSLASKHPCMGADLLVFSVHSSRDDHSSRRHQHETASEPAIHIGVFFPM